MKNQKIEKLNEICRILGKKVYFVGGKVRDELAGLKGNSDVDLTGEALGEEFAEAVKKAGLTVLATYKHTGTCLFELNGKKTEYTSFRKESYVGDSHTPACVTFGADVNQDALRRDFKCNAVYMNVVTGEITDPLGGIDDVKERRLTTCRLPEETFGEDGLRLLRLIRFAAELGFTPDEKTKEGAKANARMIRGISAERVFAELTAILNADEKYETGTPENVYDALVLAADTGVLKEILPELYSGRGMPQPEEYHKYDVLTHTFKCVYYAEREIRLAALLHDAGKPYAYATQGNFHGHEKYGEEIARSILTRLKAPKSTIERTCRLVRLHMEDSDLLEKENKVRQKIVDNADIFDDLMKLKIADMKACRDETAKSCKTAVKWVEIKEKMEREGAPFKVSDLAVNGKDLADAGYKGEEIGKKLEELFRECVITPSMNDRDVILKRLKRKKIKKDCR